MANKLVLKIETPMSASQLDNLTNDLVKLLINYYSDLDFTFAEIENDELLLNGANYSLENHALEFLT